MAGNRVHVQHDNDVITSTLSIRSRADMDAAIKEVIKGREGNRVVALCRGNAVTNAGKRIQMAKMLILTIIPTIALIVLASVDVRRVSIKKETAKEVENMLGLSTKVGELIHQVQLERGYTSMFISDSMASTETRLLVEHSYRNTDKKLETMTHWPGETKTGLRRFKTKEDLSKHLSVYRNRVLYDSSRPTLHNVLTFYNDVIREFTSWMYKAITFSQEGDDWRMIVSYQLLVSSKNDMGIERTLGSIYFLKGGFDSHDTYLWYLRKKNTGIGNLQTLLLFSPFINKLFISNSDKNTQTIQSNIEYMRNEISGMSSNGSSVTYLNLTSSSGSGSSSVTTGSLEKSTWWFMNMTSYMNILFYVQNDLADVILEVIHQELAHDARNILTSIILLCVILLICPLVVFYVKTMVSDIQRYAVSLADQTMELSRERQRTDSLLYQMIPKAVADQLKSNQEVEAESFAEVTIFFSDIVGFTSISSNCSPLEVVTLLNMLYVCFDTRLELYDVYKVETIGDAYMVASGVPKKNGRKHAPEIGTLALDLNHHVTHLEIPHMPDTPLRLRAGIHTGPVVAGVVGSKMPRYCLFGDTVNTASRMESTGLPERIQVSIKSCLAMKVTGEFTFEKRGEIEVKGKGLLETYWLLEKSGFESSLSCMPGCQKFKSASIRRISESVHHLH